MKQQESENRKQTQINKEWTLFFCEQPETKFVMFGDLPNDAVRGSALTLHVHKIVSGILNIP